MEPLQKQIQTLSHKLDALYQVIEQLDHKLTQAISDGHLVKTRDTRNSFLESNGPQRAQFKEHISFNQDLEHKDVLADGIYLETNLHSGDNHLTPEIQIQRLTAQLTAAYNRIAALEEQLLLKRIH